ILGEGPDAHDAFQASFVILARKAGSINESLAGWLYQLAHNISREARRANQRRQARQCRNSREYGLRSQPTPDPLAEVTPREMQNVLQEELAKLPEQYRTPLVLSYLEGKTGDEIARIAGYSRGTFKNRLQRGRELLRQRLARRGFGLSGAALGTLFLHNTAS